MENRVRIRVASAGAAIRVAGLIVILLGLLWHNPHGGRQRAVSARSSN